METSNDSKVMSPEEWLNEKIRLASINESNLDYIKSTGIINGTLANTIKLIANDYAAYVSRHSSSGSVWRKASEGFPVQVKPESLVWKQCREVETKKAIIVRPIMDDNYIYYIVIDEGGTSYLRCGYSDIEYLDESASRPEIKLPEKEDIIAFTDELYEEIKHGDQEHQDWLKREIDKFIEKKYDTDDR